MGERGAHIGGLCVAAWGKKTLGRLGVKRPLVWPSADWRIILRWILKQSDEGRGLDLCGS